MKMAAYSESGKEITLTTEHPLSSYGQPVVLDGETATPILEYKDGPVRSGLRYADGDSMETDEQHEMIERANKLYWRGANLRLESERAKQPAPTPEEKAAWDAFWGR